MQIEKDKWNKFVIDNNGSFLQSWEWGEFQEKLGSKILRVFGKEFQSLLIYRKLPLGKIYLYAPHGPVLKAHDFVYLSKFIKNSIQIAKKEKALFLRIDPNIQSVDSDKNILSDLGFKKTFENQPKNTVIIDLNKSENDLFSNMVAETRYSVRTAEKRGVEIINFNRASITPDTFDVFWNMFQETMSRSKLRSYPKKYFEALFSLTGDISTELHLAKAGGDFIASAIFLYYGNSVIYLYAASKKGFGRFNAPSLLIWKAITNAKKNGYKCFDFWGISYEKEKWSGITAFKKGFGGSEVNYKGAWDLPYNKFWYFLYEIYKKYFRKA
ncbi:MAG: peptidoglycan bridge formation glycyltransferase FemA/FemB family protein [bacterium]|nr:peptidoglycan bridge formation glycyltransferase FemA/FemB family protein [bacterium]